MRNRMWTVKIRRRGLETEMGDMGRAWRGWQKIEVLGMCWLRTDST